MSKFDAVVLAAGRGTRMRSLTEHIPKPLISVAGKTLIDRALDSLACGGVKQAVVNLHYRADVLQEHLEQRRAKHFNPRIIFSDERHILLDTGGGVANAIQFLETESFFIANSDVVRLDYGKHACDLLKELWNPTMMDFLLLVHSVDTAISFSGGGDFNLREDGRLQRHGKKLQKRYVYTGLCLCGRSHFEGLQGKTFSLNFLWNLAEKNKRLFGVKHRGEWLHVGSPEELFFAESKLLA